MKITNIGTYLKYKYLGSRYYSLNDESLKDLSYFSPEFFEFILDENIKTFPDNLSLLEKWDIYSFGCLLFYIFFKKEPYFFIIDDINFREELKLKKLIETKNKEMNFLKTHLTELNLKK